MAHRTTADGYQRFVQRLNRFPQGAPPTDSLFPILRLLFSENEAGLLALLPLRPFTVTAAARAWKRPESEARRALEGFADRGLVVDLEEDGRPTFFLPPPMVGFFEFTLMRVRTDIDQRLLAELYHQYLDVEDDFFRALFEHGETQVGRAFVQEPALAEDALWVLDYERASEVVRRASAIGVGRCFCRHKMEHLGRVCRAPQEICLTLNGSAASLVRRGYARPVEASEGLDLLARAYDHNLVQFGENVRQGVGFICNCCGCCCEAMSAMRRFGLMRPIHPANFLPVVDPTTCRACGTCAAVCAVRAVTLAPRAESWSAPRPAANVGAALSGDGVRIDERRCLGCGICVRNCPSRAMRLVARAGRTITPVDTVHRVVMMAVERGKLSNLIFDNQAQTDQRAFAAVLGALLRMPPVRQVLASRQVKSRYLLRAIEKWGPAAANRR